MRLRDLGLGSRNQNQYHTALGENHKTFAELASRTEPRAVSHSGSRLTCASTSTAQTSASLTHAQSWTPAVTRTTEAC